MKILLIEKMIIYNTWCKKFSLKFLSLLKNKPTQMRYNIKSLNIVLYSNDPDDLPLTDLDGAASLPYDTNIPDGGK